MSGQKDSSAQPFKPVQAIQPRMKPPTGEAAQAWSAFCDRLKTAGHLLLSQPGVEDDLFQAETLRFLIREMRAAIEFQTEVALYDVPRFYCGDNSGSGPPGPNLDNSYYSACVRPDGVYRLTIDTRTISDIILGVSNIDYRNDGDFSLSDFKVNKDGVLEVFASAERQGTNWVHLPDDAYRLSIRVYYQDWSKHTPPALTVERLDRHDPPPVPPVSALARALQQTVDHLETWPFKYPIFQTLYADQIEPNVMRPPLFIPGGGQEIQYGLSRYRLADDEALIVESAIPDAPYWGFHVYTMPWFSQIDPGNRVTSLNNLQSRIDSDGRVRYVISKDDPGIQNWLDTGGFPTGSVFYRWIWSKNSPSPTSRVVKLNDVRRALPADTPIFTLEERRKQIAERRRHLQRRFRA